MCSQVRGRRRLWLISKVKVAAKARCSPWVLDELVPADHVCRVIDAFVGTLAMAELGFERATAADTGRPGYDPGDLLKLYLYGYLNQIRSRDAWKLSVFAT